MRRHIGCIGHVLLILTSSSLVGGCGLPSCDEVTAGPPLVPVAAEAAFTLRRPPGVPGGATVATTHGQLHAGVDPATGDELLAFLAFRIDAAAFVTEQVLAELQAFQEQVVGPLPADSVLFVERLEHEDWTGFLAGLVSADDLVSAPARPQGTATSGPSLGPLSVELYDPTTGYRAQPGDVVFLRLRLAPSTGLPTSGPPTGVVVLSPPAASSPPLLLVHEPDSTSDFYLCR